MISLMASAPTKICVELHNLNDRWTILLQRAVIMDTKRLYPWYDNSAPQDRQVILVLPNDCKYSFP